VILLAIKGGFFGAFQPESVALTVLMFSVVAAAGLALGSVRVLGISLGIGGVLFAGLAVGRMLGEHSFNPEVMEFARDFGLILFVYTIGVQVGPGFLASLRRQGLRLNLLAAAIVVLGVLVTVAVSKIGGVKMSEAVGLFAGATTNTPSLAAASQTLRDVKNLPPAPTVAGYAIAYPFGIVGIILTMVLLRVVFRVSMPREAEQIAAQQPARPPLARMTLRVTNPNLEGREIRQIPGLSAGGVVVSRILRGEALEVARPRTVLKGGDVLLAVGPREGLEDLKVVVGVEDPGTDLTSVPGPITTRRVLVTRSGALGRTVDELDLEGRFGVPATRLQRGEVELSPSANADLNFGDTVTLVGDEAAIRDAARELGDSLKALNHPQVIPLFLGIALGVLAGSIPFSFPGMPAPIRLGLAGGPLLVAIVLSRLGHFGPLVWYLPLSANFALRELGIVLFLAAVGLKSGEAFFQTAAGTQGLYWLGCGALITAVPLLAVGFFARGVLKMNYMTVCGLLAGSMTDPPALQFAGTVTGSDAPSIAYAAVYPLVMLLRVVAAQVLVLAFV